MAVTVTMMMMMMVMMMIVVLLLQTNPFILRSSHPLLRFFRSCSCRNTAISALRHKEKKRPTVLIKVFICGFETLRLQNP